MGKGQIRRRSTFQRQFFMSYVWVMTLSLLTAAVAIILFYVGYHQHNGLDSEPPFNDAKLVAVMDYATKNGTAILELEKREELEQLVIHAGYDYHIQAVEHKELIHPFREEEEANQPLTLSGFLQEISSKLRHTSNSIQVPLTDKATGNMDYVLLLSSSDNGNVLILIFVDILLPFVCFFAYTFIFAGRLSMRIRTPLKELMSAVEKIKARDVDFVINKGTADNEISDLAIALEEMRNELKSSLIREWQLEQDRREMVSSITHDLRTPLAIIQGHVEGLQEGLRNDPVKLEAYLNTIGQNTRRVKKLIDDMNMLAEVDHGGFLLHPFQVDLADFIKTKADELQILANKKGITIQTELYDLRGHNRQVSIDPDRLAQIIDNVAGNSLRYTPERGCISIRASIGDDRADFRIWDNGPGFQEKDLQHVFKKFYKGDPSRSVEKGNSGLGLYIAKSIAGKFGGDITSYNLPAGGSCVEFFIRYDPADPA